MHWLNRLPSLISQVDFIFVNGARSSGQLLSLIYLDIFLATVQMNRCLKPEGVFLGTILGGETLNELRCPLSVYDTK